VFDDVVRNAAQADDVVIEDANAAARDRAHRELRLERDAELPHDEDIEGRAEGRGDFERDRHPAARQTEHEDVAARGICAESASEDSAGFAPIGKSDGGGDLTEHGARPVHGRASRVPRRAGPEDARGDIAAADLVGTISRSRRKFRGRYSWFMRHAADVARVARHDRCLDDSAMQQIFADRHHAGAQLAEQLRQYESRRDVVVLGLAPGGVPVAWEVARTLGLPLDVFVVRTVRAPRDPDLVIGSVASGEVSVLSHRVVTALGLPRATLDAAVRRALRELRRSEAAYRGYRVPLSLAGRIVIIVDDGMATRATMRAAVHAVGESKPARIVAAAPVAARATCDMLETLTDEVVCAWTPKSLSMVCLWYRYFSPTTDDEIRALLRRSDTHRLECGSRVLAQWDG
jgi:putative phosphoribosyl transferase